MRNGFICLAALLLGGCGHPAPPDGYEPARDFDCGPLIGDWLISGPADLAWVAPGESLPAGSTFNFLSIEDDHQGSLRMVLRRRTGDVLAEATTMRMTDPDDYRRWRARTLGEPEPDGPRYQTQLNPGPVVKREYSATFNECVDGWRHSMAPRDGGPSSGDESFNQTYYTLAFALDDRRNLLVQQRVARENDTGWQFFGQGVTYYTYSHSNWHRLLAVSPADARVSLTAADLPPVPSAIERLELDIARRKAISDFPLWFRDHLPAGNEITLLREIQFGATSLTSPPDQVRFEVAGRYRLAIDEPFTPVLRRHPQVGAIDIREQSAAPGNRRYVRIEFTFTLEPRSLR